MKIAVTGPRDVLPGTDVIVHAWVDSLPLDTHIFHGNAKGVDRITRDRARARGLQVSSNDRKFSGVDKAYVPFMRNIDLVTRVDLVMGFWHGKPFGGTLNTMWLVHKLYGSMPQWKIIDTAVTDDEARANFELVCKNPPEHWLKAFVMMGSYVEA